MRAAQFTGTKITGLEVQARESYLSLLQKNMRANHSEWQKYATEAESAADSSALSEADILAVAVEEEYKIFSANKVITTYRYASNKFEFTQPNAIFMQARHGFPHGGGEEGDGRVAATPGMLFSAAVAI